MLESSRGVCAGTEQQGQDGARETERSGVGTAAGQRTMHDDLPHEALVRGGSKELITEGTDFRDPSEQSFEAK